MAAWIATHRTPRLRRTSVVLASAVLVTSTVGCGSDTTGPTSQQATAQSNWSLQLNQHAVMLSLAAPTNTIQLRATAYNIAGTSLTGMGTVQYLASDSTVHIDSTGLVTAQFASGSQPTVVVASFTDPHQNLTIVDTCYVKVTDDAPASPLTTLSIQPTATDSAKRAFTNSSTKLYTVKTTAKNATGTNFTGILVRYASSDPSIAAIDPLKGTVTASRMGVVTLTATTSAYGVEKQDSLRFAITLPITQKIQVLSALPTGSTTPTLVFWPASVTVGVGAQVEWLNKSVTDSIDVIFDDPTNVDSVPLYDSGFGTGQGNIAPWWQDTVGTNAISAKIMAWLGGNCFGGEICQGRWRQFPVPGTYHYHSTLYPTSGTIIVREDSNP